MTTPHSSCLHALGGSHYDAISPDLARKIAKECGTVEILRTNTYRATARISSRIAAKYRTCRFPGCDEPAHNCDDDHIQPFNQGGQTSQDNQIPCCRRHHRIRTHGGWTVHLQPDGTVVWTSPTRERFDVPPPND